MKTLITCAVFLFISLHFVSCGCSGTILCNEGAVSVGALGFSTGDIDSMFIVTYKPDNNFDSVVDTQRNIGNDLKGDTCVLYWQADYGGDYKIVFPKLGLTYAFTNIQQSGPSSEVVGYKCEEGSPVGQFCYRNITSFTVNGQAYSPKIPTYYIVR